MKSIFTENQYNEIFSLAKKGIAEIIGQRHWHNLKEIVFISNNLDKYKEIKKVFEKSFLDLLFLKNFDDYKEPKKLEKHLSKMQRLNPNLV